MTFITHPKIHSFQTSNHDTYILTGLHTIYLHLVPHAFWVCVHVHMYN